MKEENFLRKRAFVTNIDRNGKEVLGVAVQKCTFKMLSLVLKSNI